MKSPHCRPAARPSASSLPATGALALTRFGRPFRSRPTALAEGGRSVSTWLMREAPEHICRAKQSARALALSRASALRPRAAAFFHRVTAQLVLVVLGAANALSAHPTPSASQPGDTPALVAMLASVSSRPPPRDFGGETKSPQISAFFPRLLRSHRGATEHRTHCGHHVAGGSRHRLFHSGLLASLQPELVAKSHRTEREGILVWF